MAEREWAVRTIEYGELPDQFGQLLAPEPGSAPVPVAVLLHGGFWLAQWTLTLMDPMAADLARRGVATWNIEYRRADVHGWDAMTADVAAALRHLEVLAQRYPLGLDQIILIGHSAGGQLALLAAADLLSTGRLVRPAVVVSLAGVVDLVEAARRDLGDGAVPHALGGTPDNMPQRYAASSPLVRLPLGTAQVVVNAIQDHPDLNDMQRNYAAAARAAGDRVTLIEGEGDHFTLIDPHSQVWEDTLSAASDALVHAAVARHIESLYEALGDRHRFDRHLHPDITIWESDADRMLIGLNELDQLRDARARGNEATTQPSVRPEGVQTEVWDDTALARYALRATHPDGVATDHLFRVTDVLRRSEQGWRIVHHHAEAVDIGAESRH